MDVSSSHILRAMFTLDLVRKCKKLEGLDTVLIFDDPLGVTCFSLFVAFDTNTQTLASPALFCIFSNDIKG